ncbi:hypothetical protein ANN_05740 [Periplaneta americana]|uniref:Uncharacterized protein n=1 Tax=Periplaneta americana TaxID=6978 RepID=A0ABQ8TBM3_PERAM|nr:hypothetical protein ANN_05740 [Periplaneta americana]
MLEAIRSVNFWRGLATSSNTYKCNKWLQKCGLYPLDQDVFDDTDFVPSLPTDRPLNHVESSNDSETLPVDPVPSTSSDTPNDGSIIILPAAISPQPSSSFTVNLEDISSPPKSTIARSQKRKTGSAEILTSSPYKNQLAQEREDKGAKDKTKNKQSTIKRVRRNIMKNNHIETKKQQQKTTKVALREETSSEEGSDNDDAECIFCKDTKAISGQPEVKDGYVVHHA